MEKIKVLVNKNINKWSIEHKPLLYALSNISINKGSNKSFSQESGMDVVIHRISRNS